MIAPMTAARKLSIVQEFAPPSLRRLVEADPSRLDEVYARVVGQ